TSWPYDVVPNQYSDDGGWSVGPVNASGALAVSSARTRATSRHARTIVAPATNFQLRRAKCRNSEWTCGATGTPGSDRAGAPVAGPETVSPATATPGCGGSETDISCPASRSASADR